MSQETNIFQIEIPKRSTQCVQGNEMLMPGMEYYSVLFLDDAGKYIRYDYCSSCWIAFAKNQSRSTKILWNAKVSLKKDADNLALKSRDEKALDLFKKCLQKSSQEEWAQLFILALYLARRRILFLRQEIAQENDFFLCLYEEAATEEIFPVLRKSLKQVNIEAIQSQLAEMLK